MELLESSSPVEAVSCSEEGVSEDAEGSAPKSKFQKPLVYNGHLPYSNRLHDEASELLEEIKVNLSAAIQKWELWPGTLYWTNRLSSYTRIYGYQFSKADHLKLVKLMYELVTIPNLESPLVHTWASMLGKLLQKLRLLTPDDLQLPWRPIYQLVQQVFHSKYKQLGMRIYSTAACNAVHRLVSLVRNYFPLESTQEMLDEWRPSLCPFDLAMIEAINLLSEMLPTTLPPQHHDRGFRLWFEEFLHLWLGIHATTAAEEFFVKLFVRVAKHNIGCIDWTPYLPRIFTRILRSFQLPVGSKELQTGAHKEYLDASKAATLIVSLLGGSSRAQEHLDKLMIALESYYHPSNVGKHTKKLLLFLKDLAVHFIVRLKKERHSKPCWFFYVPDSAKLTESDVDAFVRCLLPAVRMAVFSKVGTLEASLTLHNLALVRPEMVLPDLLNRTYTALETLTEPHQLTATLQCVTAISRTLLNGGSGRYPEGRAHLFSLLTLALPGIDPNDFRKTLVSGLLISALVSLVPLVDCSPAIGHFEMTEEEVELCSLTSQFEDFVLQFLDRCFALVENTGLEQTTTLDRIVSAASRDNHESIMGLGVAGSVHSVLVQCSPKLFEVALDKLYRFATSRVFESEVAGRMCADMCAAAAKVDADSALKRFIPHCVRAINLILEDPDQRESEHPDNDLIWNIQLLAHILHGQGGALVPNTDALVGCLKNCVHLKCKSAALHAAKALGNTLHCLTMIYPCESRSLATDFSAPPEEHLYIREWSAAGDLNHLGLEWHVPSVEELQMTDHLLEEFLQPELDRLQAFMQGEPMDRDTLYQSLQLVWYLLLGTAAYLPMWKGEQLSKGCPSSDVKLSREDYIFGPANAKLPTEPFSRENLAKFLHQLSEHILEKCEDDTKSMFCLVKILKLLLSNFGVDKFDFENKWRAYKQTKMALEDKLHGKKQHIRPMLIIRIHLQHELRMLERSMSTLTSLHLTLMKDLFRMAVSTYAEVRIKAQNALAHCLDVYLYAGRNLLPDIFPLLSNDDGVSHEQFKGALHVMLLPPVMSVYLHDWPLMKKTLPLIVKADHSEKPSILNLMNRILRDVLSGYDYFTLEFQVSEGSLAAAASLHSSLNAEVMRRGKARTEEVNQTSVREYEALVECLVNLVEQEKLQWRYAQMAAQFLVVLIRHDHPFPVSGVKLLVNSLNHDALAVRKLAVCAMSLILLQQKRVHAKVPVDVAKEAGVEELDTSLPPGERDDNRWLLYDTDHLPRTEQEWKAFTFVDKTHWGYYAWPKTLYTYAPYDQQPPLNRKPEQLSESERVVYDAFTSPEFVDRLVSFLSLEENKGRDHYDTNRFSMFKGMFRNFGDTFVPLLRPHLEKLAVDSQDSNQRCASEIIAGIVSGSKLWSFQMVQEMWSFMGPLMSKVLDVISPETVEDWASAMTDISANRDPRRLRWLLEIMMVNPLHGTNGSFLDASRLYLLQSVLAQQEWRTPNLQNRMLEYLKPLLDHPFKNVRERIGSVLAQIFLHDVEVMQLKFNPRRADFLELVSPRLPTVEQLPTVTQDKSVLQFCKTVLVWLITSYQHSEPEYFQLLAELLPLATVEDDEEIVALIKSTCAQMSHAEVPSAVLPVVLSSTKKAIETGLWKVRVAALQLLQVSVFENLFVFGPASVEITDLLLRLIGDTQMEVRELAASTVSGLVRCGYISCIDKLKTLFTKNARIKLPKKAKVPNSAVLDGDTGYEGLLVVRHSGVLGLAALVEACPYSVPEWLPEVLDELALHLHDPAPIQGTVKRAMSEFRRTHYDSWSEHKQKFTDDQLAVLADLLISPSYYA